MFKPFRLVRDISGLYMRILRKMDLKLTSFDYLFSVSILFSSYFLYFTVRLPLCVIIWQLKLKRNIFIDSNFAHPLTCIIY